MRFMRKGSFLFALMVITVSCQKDNPAPVAQQPPASSCPNNKLTVGSIDYILGGVENIEQFLLVCPLNDPVAEQILSDFEFRIGGSSLTTQELNCDLVLSSTLSGDVMNILQTLRLIYHIDLGKENYLPWTSSSLYNWLKANVAGINVTDNGLSNCCSYYNSKKFINIAARTEATRLFDQQHAPEGILNTLLLLIHERRHADGGGYPHCSCPLGPDACDPNYNSSDPGAYGVEFWFSSLLYFEKINIGLSKLSSTRKSEIKNFINPIALRDRFCHCAPVVN